MFETIWEKTKQVGRWIKRTAKEIFVVVLGIGIALAVGIPDKTFENLSNVAKEQGLYRVSFDKWSEVEIPEVDTPEIKLKKWGEETFIKVSYPDFDKKIKPKQENKKLKWKGNDTEVHLYPLEPREFKENGHTVKQLEQGGFEFEVILKKKPKTNKIVLNIETRGLKFYYQPELTQEEKDDGAFRPENVVGSYAVYHATKTPMHSSPKEAEKYKVGKAFHIYRPKIIDSNGWEVWGELNIDIEKGIQTIIIPQDFIDNAIYPIRQASGDLFGWDGIGGSYAKDKNYIQGSQFTGAAGTATKITVYEYPNSGDKRKCALYTHSNSQLLTNGTTNERATDSLKNWYDYTFPVNPTISAVDYVLVRIVNYDSNYYYFDDGEGAEQGHYQYCNYGSFPPSTASFTHEDRKYSIYCTYTPGEVGTNIKVNIGDAWKDVDSIKINIGDIWKDVSEIKINIGDAWKAVY